MENLLQSQHLEGDEVYNVTPKNNVTQKEILENMKKMEEMINELIKRGNFPDPKVVNIKKKTELEKYYHYLSWKESMFQNTQIYLERYHQTRKLNEEWILELASEVDMPLPINRRKLKETIADIIMYERKGHERIRAICNRINDINADINRVEHALNILKQRPDGHYSYCIIENSYLVSAAQRSTIEQLKALKENYGINISKTTYYEHRKKAIEELSVIVFGASNPKESILNYFASILFECNVQDTTENMEK